MELDWINALFEVTGGLFIACNIHRLHRDKQVMGVSIVAVVFFAIWGWFNLVYYPVLGQWASAFGAGSVAIANTLWLGQIIYYSRGVAR